MVCGEWAGDASWWCHQYTRAVHPVTGVHHEGSPREFATRVVVVRGLLVIRVVFLCPRIRLSLCVCPPRPPPGAPGLNPPGFAVRTCRLIEIMILPLSSGVGLEMWYLTPSKSATVTSTSLILAASPVAANEAYRDRRHSAITRLWNSRRICRRGPGEWPGLGGW